MSRCRSCNAEITWARTPGGKRIPLDASPVADGNIVIRNNSAIVLARADVTPTLLDVSVDEGETRYVSHFATCPSADEHRSKADHVRGAGQSRRHTCHWPGCDKQVPPAMWGCKQHWYSLPDYLRAGVWAAYVPGQEDRMDPSEEYLAVAREVQRWIER